MKEHLKLLGFKVRDVVTGFEGVVSSISFDLYGCVQAIVTPPAAKDEKEQGGRWFDTKRLSLYGDEPVMEVPDFGGVVPGGDYLPAYPSKPVR